MESWRWVMFIRHREWSSAIHSRWSRLGHLHPGPTHYECHQTSIVHEEPFVYQRF